MLCFLMTCRKTVNKLYRTQTYIYIYIYMILIVLIESSTGFCKWVLYYGRGYGGVSVPKPHLEPGSKSETAKAQVLCCLHLHWVQLKGAESRFEDDGVL
jgi:hypothetical protein